MKKAFFGPPVPSFVGGGTHITVHLVPVYRGRVVAFDVTAPEARGRWLPWDVLPWRGNPYETASELADDWCEGRVTDLRLVDVLSFPAEGGGWELALVFRAALAAPPPGDEHRTPVLLADPPTSPVRRFAPVDLQRWAGDLSTGEAATPPESDHIF